MPTELVRLDTNAVIKATRMSAGSTYVTPVAALGAVEAHMTKSKDVPIAAAKASSSLRGLTSAIRITKNNGEPWADDEVSALRALAKERISARLIGIRLGRTAASIRSKFAREGITAVPQESGTLRKADEGES